MIKINRDNLDQIALEHYNRIINYNNAGNLIDFLENKINSPKGQFSFGQYRDLYRDFKYDLKGMYNRISILIAKPNILAERIEYYEYKYGNILKNNKFRDYLSKNIFYYKKYYKWSPYLLAKALEINVCPYCNRQYTFTLGIDTDKGTRPQFDHFFDKSKYPFLALSFYNLIPSCYICNSNLKNSSKFNLNNNIHPYLYGYEEDIKFTIIPKNIGFSYGKANSYKIKFKLTKTHKVEYRKIKKIIGNYQTFCIKELYNKHKDYVDEIIVKAKIFSNVYINQLYQQFNGVYFSNLNDVYRVLLGNYITTEELEKRVLSKLTKDIAEDLNFLPL